MKKNMLSLLVALLLLTLVLSACGNAPTQNTPASTPPAENGAPSGEVEAPPPEHSPEPDTPEDGQSGESKILVAYFSRVGVTPFDESVDAVSSASVNVRNGEMVGNTQYLAEFIAEETGGDLHQIITEKEYPTDYRDTTDLASEEQSADERPALTSLVEDMAQYDVIFLGYPNWWGTLPQAVMTFLEEYDFDGKTIVPFCSHGGSRLGSGPRDIAALCPGAELLDGLAVSASAVSGAQADVRTWLEDLNLDY